MNSQGFTLIELAAVIILIGIIATMALKKSDGVHETARQVATERELTSLSYAIRGNPALYESGKASSFGYVGDVGSFPTTLADLVTQPAGYATWNGPYIADNGSGDYAKDAWETAYVYTGGATIQSTGSGSTITKQLCATVSDYTSNSVRGVIYDAAGLPPDKNGKANVTISLTYPDGAGGLTTTMINPSTTGAFVLNGIPVGNYDLQIVNATGPDTVTEAISVLPNSTITVTARFGVVLW